jgi:hypothetical protein
MRSGFRQKAGLFLFLIMAAVCRHADTMEPEFFDGLKNKTN